MNYLNDLNNLNNLNNNSGVTRRRNSSSSNSDSSNGEPPRRRRRVESLAPAAAAEELDQFMCILIQKLNRVSRGVRNDVIEVNDIERFIDLSGEAINEASRRELVLTINLLIQVESNPIALVDIANIDNLPDEIKAALDSRFSNPQIVNEINRSTNDAALIANFSKVLSLYISNVFRGQAYDNIRSAYDILRNRIIPAEEDLPLGDITNLPPR